MDTKKVINLVKPKLIFISSDAPTNSKWSDYTALKYALDNGKTDLANILLNGHCRVNSDSNTPTETPLHKAVKLGDTELFNKLLTKGASLTAVDREGNTPLHLAFILKRTNLVRSLLGLICEHKIYNNLKNNQGLTYLHIACTQNNQTIIKGFLNAGANIQDAIKEDSPYWPGFTVMRFAIEFKLEQAAEALVQANKKSISEKLNDSLIINYIFHQQNNKDKYGFYKELTNFHVACMKDNPDILECYIKFGAALNIPLSSDVTLCPLYLPLHFAVEGNCRRNVEVLLKHGAMIDLWNSLRMTPLHLAFYHQHHEIVDLLWTIIKEDLVINSKDYYLLSYLHIAVAKNELDVVKNFCDSGEDVNAEVLRNSRNFSYYSPLHFAVRYQHLQMAQFLIDRGAEVNIGNEINTPLHLAIESGNKSFVDLLLRNGAEVDDTVRNDDKQTVLHVLVSKNDSEMLDYAVKFVELGCDVNATDLDGNTALHLAATAQGSSFAKILLDLGADINAENDKGWTPLMETRDSSNTFDVLCNHIRKLKALGAKICSSNEVALNYAPSDSTVDRQIKDEIEKMKSIELSAGCMTLSDFLLLEPNVASTYVAEEALKLIAEDESLMVKYPMYGYLIKLQFRRGTEYSSRRKRSSSFEIIEEVASKRRCHE